MHLIHSNLVLPVESEETIILASLKVYGVTTATDIKVITPESIKVYTYDPAGSPQLKLISSANR